MDKNLSNFHVILHTKVKKAINCEKNIQTYEEKCESIIGVKDLTIQKSKKHMDYLIIFSSFYHNSHHNHTNNLLMYNIV